MKISEITAANVAEYLKIEDSTDSLLEPVMEAAKRYIMDETALESDELDDHEDLAIAFLVLCQDLYDNRSYSEAGQKENIVVSSILGHHRRNLL